MMSSDCVFCLCFGMFSCVSVCVSCRYDYIKTDEPFVRVTERPVVVGSDVTPPPNNFADGCRTPFDSHPLCCRLPVSLETCKEMR